MSKTKRPDDEGEHLPPDDDDEQPEHEEELPGPREPQKGD